MNLDSQSLLRNIKPVEISTKLSTGFQMPGKVVKENGKSQKWKRKRIKI